MKYRAMIFCPVAPEGQPKARRVEVSGNDFLSGRAEATTESKGALKFRAMISSAAAPKCLLRPGDCQTAVIRVFYIGNTC